MREIRFISRRLLLGVTALGLMLTPATVALANNGFSYGNSQNYNGRFLNGPQKNYINHNNNNNDSQDVVRSPLYRDGSISCTGVDDTSRRGGQVVLFPMPDEVAFKVKLRNAQPNTDYRLAISREPNCADAEFYPVFSTDSQGNADVYGSYDVPSGNRNLLINIVATESVNNNRNREIGTTNAWVHVP